jgi:hypothetical protein
MNQLAHRVIASCLAAALLPAPSLSTFRPTNQNIVPNVEARLALFRGQVLAMRLGFIADRIRRGFSSRVQGEVGASPIAGAPRDVVLPRWHFFEFNDQSWVPEIIRSLITFALGRGFEHLGAGKLVGDVLASHVHESGTPSILELAAGSAMPSVELFNHLRQSGMTIPYQVSDLYPDLEAFQRASKLSLGGIQSIEQPVDVLHVPANLRGLRLMVTSFHHFRPEHAAQLLKNAYDERSPIAIFELTDRRFLRTLLVMPLGILSMLMEAPGIFKLHSWRGLLWLLPAAFAYGFDGLVSCFRSYTLSEWKTMTQPMNDGYSWRMGVIATAIPGIRITYLLGGVLANHIEDARSPTTPEKRPRDHPWKAASFLLTSA